MVVADVRTVACAAAVIWLAVATGGCSKQADLMVVNEYDVTVKVLSSSGNRLIAVIQPGMAQWSESEVPALGPNSSYAVIVQDESGKELERRSISSAEATQNTYKGLIVISVGGGGHYKALELSKSRSE